MHQRALLTLLARTVSTFEASNVLAFERAKPSGYRRLIVEDEMLIALDLIDTVAALGASSVTASRAAKALFVTSELFDAAIVDMNLAGERADAVVDALGGRHIPVIIVTGYCLDAIAVKYRGWPVLTKPFKSAQIEASLLLALAASKVRARAR